ncbi:MAG: fibronectin type III domain-containing protein [Flavobacteriales bacterium]|nr:fibronectin type III domain-containing protein [Flavobacteriales bacterium]
MPTLLYFVKLALSQLSPAKLVERARAIVLALTGNLAYTTPNPPLVDITAAADALETADTAVLNNGGKQDYLARNERMQELRDKLTLLGAYVQVTSGGDPEKILSAGYPTRKAPEPVGLVPAPKYIFAVASALTGVIDLRWGRVRGRMFYEVEINLGNVLNNDWKPLVAQSANVYAATGLASDVLISFRVRAVGAAGPGPWSDPAIEKAR